MKNKEFFTKDGILVTNLEEVYYLIEPDTHNGFEKARVCSGDEIELRGDGFLWVRIIIPQGASEYDYWEIKKVSECYSNEKILENER